MFVLCLCECVYTVYKKREKEGEKINSINII